MLLACATNQNLTALPTATFERIVFEVQTPTATVVLFPTVPVTDTPPPTETPTLVLLPTQPLTLTESAVATETPLPEPTAVPPTNTAPPPPPTATPVPALPTVAPQIGGEWDFEAGFVDWANPHGDQCPEGRLAVGWQGFTTRDQFGSSCLNRTTYGANVHIGEAAQEITFAFVGNEAGISKVASTTPSHQYTIEAFAKPEFSPSPLEIFLGVDLTGQTNWQADSITWYPWRENGQDIWLKTQETVVATGESLTVFIRGHHPLPEGGGALRIDSVSLFDKGPG